MASAKGMNNGNRQKQAAARLLMEQALRHRAEGMTLSQIATAMSLKSPQHASLLIQKGLKLTIEEPAENLRAIEIARLDGMMAECLKVMKAYHIVVNQGVAVRDPRFQFDPEEHEDGSVPEDALLRDTGPVLSAVDRLLKISERRSKLLGLDAPKRTELSGPEGGDIPITEVRRVIIDPKR